MDSANAPSEQRVNFVPCVKWVRRGIAKANPDRVKLTREELINLIKDAKSTLSNVTAREAGTSQNEDDESDAFNMENYDNEESTTDQLGIQSLIEIPPDGDEIINDDDDSDKEDDTIKPTDNLVIVGRVDGDACVLEIYVHNESEGSLYCHHDFFLPSFPLCLEWLDFEPKNPQGSYCAIGSMTAEITVWDLDMMDCLEPAYTLGRQGSRRKGIKHIGHRDAVLSLAWNTNFHHVLASGSVDKRIILWDIDKGLPNVTIEGVFQDKVQCLKWQEGEGFTLLAGGCDNTARIFDCRNKDEHKTFKLSGEAEQILWDVSNPNVFLAGTSTGNVDCFDIRNGPIWSKKVHEKEVTGLSFSSIYPNLLTTASADNMLKVWEYNRPSEPRLVCEKELNMGIIHSLDPCPDSGCLFAIGGDNKSKNFSVIDLLTLEGVSYTFRGYTNTNDENQINGEMEMDE